MTPPNMLRVDDLTWPVTYRYVCANGSGFTSWELSVDVPSLNTLHDDTAAYGAALWAATIATAITSSIALIYYDTVIHKMGGAIELGTDIGSTGRIVATPAPRDKTAVIGFNTEHGDTFGRRRFYLFGMPNAWQDANGLTEEGWNGAMAFGHLMAIGCSLHFGSGLQQLLIPYWNVFPFAPENVYGVGFRRVASYNVFQYTEKAPDGSDLFWPPASP